MAEKRVLVTGANGFVGQPLCEVLERQGYLVRRATRTAGAGPRDCLDGCDNSRELVSIGEIGPETDWQKALEDVAFVVHLAARVHIQNRKGAEAWAAFQSVNVRGTERLAEECTRAGVKRFIYLSSIKVNGEETSGGSSTVPIRFSESDLPRPQDAYALSKWQAERALQRIAEERKMEVVIIRPPLIYGPRVTANFGRLLQWVHSGVPLPLRSISNKRSMLYVENLCDFVLHCLWHPGAAGETFIVADDEVFSTPELICNLARALGRKPLLVSFPPFLLMLGACLVGQAGSARRLLSSLQVETGKARRMLQWTPPSTADEGLRRTARWYLEDVRRKGSR